MRLRDPLSSPLTDGPASGRPHGMHLPFLPTIATAVIVAAASLLCRETVTTAPVPAETAQILIAPTSFADGRVVAEAAGTRPTAALAFAQLHPLTFEAAEPRMAARPGARFAVLPPRRPCPGPRCGEAIPRRANPFAAAHPADPERVETAPVEVGEADEPFFPRLALPFAPVARAVGEATGMMGRRAAALGASAMLLADRLR
ncbi:hypothetical protein [Methylobacterium sp. sgz302541]|uniref:hypothetical protein n=1 Tax=unclassified Methylobacterium TaxID=2615210 RepID=UPI003D331C04